MAAITTTGTLTAGNSRTFALAPGSALTLTLLPNCRVTVTETPETVSASDAGGNSPRTHNHQLAGVFTYGPYAMGGSVVVENASNSGSTVTWGRKDTTVSTSSDGTSLVSGDGNTSFDIRPKQQTPGGAFCNWQASTGTLAMVSTDAGDDIALDTAVTLDGLPTAKCTWSNAASGTFLADFTFTNAISLAGFKTLQVPVKITCNETASGVGLNTAAFQIWLYLSGGGTVRLQCDFANVPPGSWHTFSFSRQSTTTSMVVFGGGATWASFDTETVTKVRVVQATIAASVSYPVWIGALRCDARARGCVSIVMDGCYISQYTILKPLFDSYSIKTSLAIVNSFIGSSASFMTAAQINEMYLQGHECIHHTYDGTKQNGYVNATDWPSTASIAADIKAGFGYFVTQGWTRGLGKAVNAFTSPFAKSTSQTRQNLILDAMRTAGVQCSRASAALYTTQMSLGYKGVAPFHVQGAIQITSTDTPAAIQTIIDQAEANGEWAVITVHRAVASSPGSLEMTTADFTTWLAYLATRRAAGNLDVLPFGEAFDRYLNPAA